MSFRAVVGHHHGVELLSRAVARGSLPPSLIFSGPEGVGKRRVATALAQALNCLQPLVGDEIGLARGALSLDACGVCTSCRRIERGIHPDVLAVGLIGDAATIKTDQAREIVDHAAYRPYEGRRRVVIVDPADRLEVSAQNVLLKLLEEPPAANVLVLVTAHPDALLPTVRSRCPQVRFGPLTVTEVAEVLVREEHLPEHEARAAAIVSGGTMTRALEAVSAQATDARGQALTALSEAASASPALHEQMKAIFGVEKRQGSAAAEREQLSLALRALSSLLRDLAVLDERGGTGQNRADGGAPGGDLANLDLVKDLEGLSPSFRRDRVMRAFAAVDRALSAVRGNASPKLVVDWLAYQI